MTQRKKEQGTMLCATISQDIAGVDSTQGATLRLGNQSGFTTPPRQKGWIPELDSHWRGPGKVFMSARIV